MDPKSVPKAQAVLVQLTPGSFTQFFTKLGRKPNLVPFAQNAAELRFEVEAGSVPMTVILRDDGTWAATAVVHV